MDGEHSIGAKLTSLWEILSSPPPQNTQELWKEHQQIRVELNSISPAPDADKDTDRTQFIEQFLEWANEKGIAGGINEISIGNSEKGGLCLKARKELAAESILMRVPQVALLSSDHSESCRSLSAILENDQMLKSMDNVALVMVLAHEVLRGEKSPWRPYIQLLPSRFTTPLFYSLEQLQQLKPSPCFHEALMIYRAVARQYTYFSLRIISDYRWLKDQRKRKGKNKANMSAEEQASEAPFSLGVFTEANLTFYLYRWCVSVVSTRINIVPSKKKDGKTPPMIPALIPFVDFANHEYTREENPTTGSVYFDGETREIHLQIHRNLRKDDEVLIHYGVRSNSEFLIHNGFVPEPPNPGNSYQLRIGLPKSSLDFDRKLHHICRLNIKQENLSTFVLILRHPPSISDSLLWEFAKIFVSNSVDEANGEDESRDLKAKKFLKDRFQLLFKSYETLESEQNGHVMDAEQESVLRSIKRLKHGECELLKAYADQL